MTLKQWNKEQIILALKLPNRLKYFLVTGSILPSRQNLVLFYIKRNAKSYAEHHKR